MRRWFCWIALSALAAAGPASSEAGGLRVGEIHVLRKEVFNPSVPGYDRFPYSWLNALHIRTREPVIRGALLFRPGDPFDPELLDETERTLRNLSFINYASVIAADRRDSLQDVVVETHDIWSTQLSVEVGSRDERAGGGNDRIEVKLEEQNLFGFGKRIELTYRRADGEEGFGWLLSDPQVLGSRWTARVYDRSRSPGRDRGVEIALPLYSLVSRWGVEAASLLLSGEDRAYRRDEEVARFFRESRWDNLQVGRMFGPRHSKFIVRGLFIREQIDFTDLRPAEGSAVDSSILEAGGETRRAAAGLSYGRFSFAEEEGIDFMDRVEDIELGGYGALTAGPSWGDASRWRLLAEAQLARRMGEHRYASCFATCSADREGSAWGRTSLGAAARVHDRWTDHVTFAGRATWEERWRADPGREFFADSPNGLRGYDDRSDAGLRRLLLNMESRFDTGIRVLTVGIGAAAFFDAGAAWDRDEPVRFDDLRSSVGLGLRLGLTKTRDGNTFRLDLARNLRDGSLRFEVDLGHLFYLGRPFSDFRRPVQP